MLTGNWSVKFEYLYYDLGRTTYGLSPLSNANGTALIGAPGILYTAAVTSSTHFNGEFIRAGVNFHF